MFDDPQARAGALERIRLLQSLTDDLTDIIAGTRPSPQDLKDAVLLRNFMIGEHQVPCLVGTAEGHPRLGTKLVTTSQLFLIDPYGKWARTFSRFYRLDNDAAPSSRPYRKCGT